MNRILYSCLLFVLLGIGHHANAQVINFTVLPNDQCYNSTGSYTMDAGLFVQSPGATSYIWTITPVTATCQPTYTFGQHGALNPSNTGSQIAISYPCCGTFSISVFAMFSLNPPTPTGAMGGSLATIYCPTGGSVSVSPSLACISDTFTFTGTGGTAANSYTWSNGFVGNPATLTAVSNTCMTYTATTAQGCTISPAPACGSVQAVSMTVSPASQTICAGAPICLTATAQAINQTNTTNTPPTATTQIQWYDPNGNLAATVCTTTPVNGTYSAIVTHTGAAGTCTYMQTANVFTSNVISVSITPSSPSVCPGASVQLTGVSVSTIANTYTWTKSPSATPIFTGNPYNVPFNGPGTYVVNVDYFGCPGSASITIGTLALTPSITASNASICPGSTVLLTASGGITYTFRYHHPNPLTFPNSTVIPKGSAATATVVHSPSVIPNTFPALYSVTGFSNGCSGTASVTVYQRTISPSLVASSASVCPNSEFTLTAGNVGASTNYTFFSSYAPNTYVTGPTTTLSTVAPTLPQTYTVQADSSGCRGSAQLTVDLLTLQPTITASSYSICPGTTISLAATGGTGTTWTWLGPDSPAPSSGTVISTSSVTSNISHTTTTNPYYPLTYTLNVDSGGCVGSNTVVINEKKLDAFINFTISPSHSICPGKSFTVTAGTASGASSFNYTFTAPGPNNLPNISPNSAADAPPSLNPSPTYTINADSSSCTGFTTFSIYERKINPVLIASNTLVCSGMPVTLTATNVGYGATTSYTFGTLMPSAGVITGGGPTFSFVTHNPTVQTVYTVLVDSAGCTAAIPPTLTVSIRPDLVLTPGTTAASVCPGLSATLSVQSPTYVTWPVTYTWSQTAGSGSLLPYPPPSDSAQVFPVTNSTYSVFALDSLGCVGSATINVDVDPNISFPVMISSSGSTICAKQSVTLTTTHTVNTIGGLTYTWSPITGTLSSIYNSTLAVSPSVTTAYSVLVQNPYGCIAGATYTVPVGQYPVVQPVATATGVCVGFTSTLTAFGANTYSWTGSTFTNVIVQQSISVPFGTYTVIGSNGGGCLDTAFVKIDSLPNLTIKIAQSSATTCIESNSPKYSKPVQLDASGAATYVWFPYNPINMTYSLGPKTDVRPPSTTCYTVIGSTAICSGTGQVCINVIPQFTMNVVPPLPAMCLGDTLRLSIANIATTAVGPQSAWTYSWTEAENAPPISLSNNLAATVQAFPQNTTTYTVEVRDSRKCISLPRLVTVTVLPKPITSIAIPTINSIPTNSLCYVGLNPGAPDVTINLLAINGNTGLKFGVVPTYTWVAPYGTKYNSILTPSNSSGVTVNAPVRVPSVAVYTVISGYNGVSGCIELDTVSVRVMDCRPVRDVLFTTVDLNDTICARNCITFQNLTDTMAGGPQNLEWSFPGGSPSTSTLQIPTVCYNLPGQYNVILKVTNQYPISTGGSSQIKGQLNYIKVEDMPNVTIIPPGRTISDTTIRFGQTIELEGSGARTYEWEPDYNITSLTNPKVKVSPLKNMQYILKGYNSRTCFSSDTINVIVIEDCGEMYVPNAFTPNNDGVNDVLYVRGICLQTLTFMVFNRWGEKVFETSEQSKGWDGTYKGAEMNTGVFVYRLEGKTYDGKAFSLKGNVTLIR